MKKALFILAVAGIISSCTEQITTNTSASGSAANEMRLQEFYDQVINAHNVALIDSFTAPGFIDHTPGPGYTGDVEGVKRNFTDFFAAFPDIKVTTLLMMSKGDTIMSKIRMTGTNTGPMMGGGPPTNKAIDIEGIDIVIIKNGVGTERWGYFEDMKMMEQLGMMQPHGAPDTTAAAAEQ